MGAVVGAGEPSHALAPAAARYAAPAAQYSPLRPASVAGTVTAQDPALLQKQFAAAQARAAAEVRAAAAASLNEQVAAAQARAAAEVRAITVHFVRSSSLMPC